jgi:hypothetical protein
MGKCRSPEAGFTLAEVLATLLIMMFAILIAANALTAQASLTHRLTIRQELLRSAEVVLESVRGGLVPFESGPVRLHGELGTDKMRVLNFVKVSPQQVDDLYVVSVRSSTSVRGQEIEVTVRSMVWRP